MAVVMVGLVYYADDPNKAVFRQVFQMDTDPKNELDDPTWVTMGCDPSRTAIMVKVAPDSPEAAAPMTGTP